MNGGLDLLLSVFALLACAGMGAADQQVYAGDSIQAAINNATAGETIYVNSGTYVENLHVEVPLTLCGDGATIRALVVSAPAMRIVSNSTMVQGFTIMGAWRGFSVEWTENITIADNTIHDNQIGIYVRDSSDVLITDNIVHDCDRE